MLLSQHVRNTEHFQSISQTYYTSQHPHNLYEGKIQDSALLNTNSLQGEQPCKLTKEQNAGNKHERSSIPKTTEKMTAEMKGQQLFPASFVKSTLQTMLSQ